LSSVLRAVNVIGRILIGLGLLLVLFTAYQLWGTGLVEAHSQAVLRSELDHQLPPGAPAAARHLSTHHVAVHSGAPATAPPRAAPQPGQPVGVIQIPSIGLDQVIVEGVGTDDLRLGPGHYPGTPLPGQAGNVAIAGHRTTYAHPFYSLDAVTSGDQIVITTPQGIFVYATSATQVVAPTDVAVLDPTPGAGLTLTTCNPRYSAATRLVLHATLLRSLLFSAAAVHSRAPAPTEQPGHQAIPANALGEGGDGDWLPAVGWGLATAAAAFGIWLLARSVRHPWAVGVPGLFVLLVLLFLFFGSVSPLLPASF
jgi:sortase A